MSLWRMRLRVGWSMVYIDRSMAEDVVQELSVQDVLREMAWHNMGLKYEVELM